MGWMTRFEPATSGSTDRRSNQLSYIHHKSSIVIILIFGRFCQKNFPPRFCKPGRTNKQPLIKSAAAGHKNPAGARNFKRSRQSAGSGRSTRESNPLKHANTARGKRSTGGANSSRHAKPAGSGRSARPRPQAHTSRRAHVLQGRAMQTPPGVAQLFSRCRRLRGGQVAQALAHLVLCQHPLFRRPQAHL